MKKNKIILLVVVVFAVFLLSFGVAVAQETVEETEVCTIEDSNGDSACTEQGLQLATLLENRGLSFSLIVIAGLLDGVNPCAVGMLILLLGYLLVFAKKPDKMIKLGLIYISTIFVTYFLIGIAFSQIVNKLLEWPLYNEVSHIIKWVIVALIWLAALINLKDVFFYGKGFTLGVTKKEVPILMNLIKKVDWHATILLGIVVTLFELPCSLPLYVGSIAIMTEAFSFSTTIFYLFVYVLMFVLPLILVFAVLVKSHHIFEAKDIQERSNKWMKLSMAIAQILIGVGLLLI